MKFTHYILILLLIIIHSCNYDSQKKDNNTVINNSSGWWIYGEGLHLYKDEISLEENIIHFLNEDSLNLIELYMSVTEMEYFPLEVEIKFENKKDSLLVHDFNITYIQGCDEQ